MTLFSIYFIMLAASSEERNVTVCRPSVYPIGILTVTHQGQHVTRSAYISVQTIRRTDVFVTFATFVGRSVFTAACMYVCCLFVSRITQNFMDGFS